MITLEALLSKGPVLFHRWRVGGRCQWQKSAFKEATELLIYNIYKMCLNLDTCY
jgi:hypothetical protein